MIFLTYSRLIESMFPSILSSSLYRVDDELDLNFTLKVTLEAGGFKVDSFDEPLMALENFRDHPTC